MFDFLQHFDLQYWVSAIGYAGVIGIIFLETGIFLGFFFPGDSLLFIAGMLASKGVFDITILIPALITAAILGYMVAFWIGRKFGHYLMKRGDFFIFKKKHLVQAHEFYERHGGKALILGRLVPIIRTFVPVVAGMADMSYQKYFVYNVIGALVWCGIIPLLGYFIGGLIPNAEHYVLPAVLVVIFLSILPGIIHFMRERRKNRKS